MSDTPTLAFTGERFTPECVREIWYEHWHRYAFARALARGRRVLDAACGEGYGSALLAQTGRDVLGLDIGADAIAHARARYGERDNLRFEQADVAALEHLPAAGFDLIVSFETLEHLHAQEAMLDGFARLLAPGGVLLVSTPDRRTYSDLTGFHNEHHVRELYRDEFEALLAPRFPAVRLYGQKLLFQSALWRLDGMDTAAAATLADDGVEDSLAYAPLYYIAACAREADSLDALPGLHLFGDAQESVYAHYNDEIRKGIAAGHRLIELENQLAVEREARRVLEQRLAAREAQ
ncbi:MAG: class I SAM-dependent methyltransferase [Lysobacteraceae bacterium]